MKRLQHTLIRGLSLATLAGLWVSAVHAITPLADQPLFTNTGVPGNLALALSVEWPTVSRTAHTATYTAASEFQGYFDPNKCYRYQHVATETASEVSHFYPVGLATGRTCTATGANGTWSGNFLNWANMIAVDPFRWALTGGLRRVDEVGLTILERARHSGQGLFGNRQITGTTLISGATPFTWGTLRIRVNGMGTQMLFNAGDDAALGNANSANWVQYTQGVDVVNTATYRLQVRVKVCDPSASAGGVEPNCVRYSDTNHKPEGLIQAYADRMRFSAFGYLNDSSMLRDGGVLRARKKFVGPLRPVPGSPALTNAAAEWDPATGIFFLNPDAADAASSATEFDTPIPNSGVINYLNKFGQLTNNPHKSHDPVSELFYAVTRYYRNLGNVPEWTSMAGATAGNRARWADQFPVITDWEDPIQYSCQRNFVLGIGDIYTHRDKNLPGTGTGTVDEPPKPASVVADTGVDSVAETTKAFALQGLAPPNANSYSGRNNSAGMVGLAYHANTRDLRPDIPGKQTVSTYWVDVLEAPFVANNQFYLAAKFGGFTVPPNFDPINHSTPLPESWWRTTTDTVGSQPRPDNYFTAGQPAQMISSLRQAFASIAAAMRAYTTSFSTSLPQVSISGNASYSAQFDSENWTGELVASELAFSAVDGTPSLSTAWSFSARLGTLVSGTGWDTGRRMATWNPATGQGVPFRHASLSAAQQAALNTPWRTVDDSADFLNYLRGQRLHERGSTDAASSKAYRTRTSVLGDIVGSKARPVGPPAMPYSNASNPGYGAFRAARAGRIPMVYVGTNAGVLHGIDGRLTGATAGREMFGYVPSALFQGPSGTPAVNGLAALGNPDYEHRYFVNATPVAYDIDFGRTQGGSGTPDWRTVLLGGLGKGGRSIYALDITDPAGMTSEAAVASRVLWEFSDPDLGFTFGEPLVVKTAKYGWVVIVGSGYNNTDGQGYFFVINPRTGALLEKVGTGDGTPAAQAGLAHVNAFVLDRTDGTADAAYAGDLLGNVWRLDLTGTTGSYPAPLRLARLRTTGDEPQPVTSRPLIEVDPRTGHRFVLVGTGRLLANSDLGGNSPQSFYALRDGNLLGFAQAAQLPAGVTWPLLRGNLADNTNLLDDISYDPGTQAGWYVELSGGGGGWRVVNDPASAFGVVSFAATQPSGDACNPSGSTRIYAISLGTGRSVLTSGPNSYINYSTALSSVVTDLRFYTVNGVARLIAGSDAGEVGAIQGVFGTPPGVRRMNWRELPVAN